MNSRKIALSLLITCTVTLTGCNATGVTDRLKDFGLPLPNQTEETSTGTKIAAGSAGCAVGGGIGWFGTQYFGRKMREQGYDYADEEIKKASAVVAGLGCVVGGKVALDIIKNMDEEAKRAQEEAWQMAQQQSQAQATRSPQAWKSGVYEGEVEIVEPVLTAEGRECATRRNFIKSDQGEAEQYIPVCKNSNGTYEEVSV